MDVAPGTYYHVVGDSYVSGDDLRSWNDYTERYGVPPGPWKWKEAEEGYDGEYVSLFDTLSEAEEYRADHGGTILAVSIPADWREWGDVTFTRNAEGYVVGVRRIPARWIEEVE